MDQLCQNQEKSWCQVLSSHCNLRIGLAWRLFVSPSPLHPKEQCSLNILVSNYNTPQNSLGVHTLRLLACPQAFVTNLLALWRSISFWRSEPFAYPQPPHLPFLSISIHFVQGLTNWHPFAPEFLAQAVPSRFTVLSLQWGVLKPTDWTARLV